MATAALAFSDRMHGLVVGSSAFSDPGARGVVWRTEDAGTTWVTTTLDVPGLSAVAVAGAGRAWVAARCPDGPPIACHPELLASDDSGATWRRLADIDLTSISFADAEYGWATVPSFALAGGVGAPSIQATVDGGRTWLPGPQPCRFASMWPVGVSLATRADGWAACAGEGSAGQGPCAIVRTRDGGRTWTTMAKNGFDGPAIGALPCDYLSGLSMLPDGHGVSWGGRGTTAATVDGGRTWNASGPGEFDVTLPSAMQILTDATWLTTVFDGTTGDQRIERSEDAGATWTTLAVVPQPDK